MQDNMNIQDQLDRLGMHDTSITLGQVVPSLHQQAKNMAAKAAHAPSNESTQYLRGYALGLADAGKLLINRANKEA
jgi:hypothetical protein